MKYVYPAIFTKEESGTYSVYFPDLEGCYTCGDNLADALMMAEDVLAFTLYGYEKESKSIPAPSELKDLFTSDNEFINYISCGTSEYHKINSNILEPLELAIPKSISARTLADMDHVVSNFKRGDVSPVIDLSDFVE